LPKVLFVTRESEKSKSIGLWKKNINQMDFFNQSGFDVQYFHLESNDNFYVNSLIKNSPYFSQYKWKKLSNFTKHVDIIYIRYPMGDREMVQTLKEIKIKSPKIKILLEIPTYPYLDELTNKKISFFYIRKDNFATQNLYKYVDRIITFSNDDEIWGIPTFKISNTVNFEKISSIKKPVSNNCINLIAVATFGKWHGYDRVIHGLAKYYEGREKNSEKIKLHLVGTGKILGKYKQIVKDKNLQNIVLFHGLKNGNELDQLYEIADIALDSMGRHRSNVFYNSTLKGKEYGAKGLPIVSGVETELDNFQNFPYYLRVPADDSPINIEEIIKFYNEIFENKDKSEIIKEIRSFNEKEFNVYKVWRNVIDFMNL